MHSYVKLNFKAHLFSWRNWSEPFFITKIDLLGSPFTNENSLNLMFIKFLIKSFKELFHDPAFYLSIQFSFWQRKQHNKGIAKQPKFKEEVKCCNKILSVCILNYLEHVRGRALSSSHYKLLKGGKYVLLWLEHWHGFSVMGPGPDEPIPCLLAHHWTGSFCHLKWLLLTY